MKRRCALGPIALAAVAGRGMGLTAAAQAPQWTEAGRLDKVLVNGLSVSPEGWPAAVGIAQPDGAPRITVGDDFRLYPTPEPFSSVATPRKGILWATGERGIWHSRDEGKSWKLHTEVTALRVILFPFPNRGYALGSEKTVLETTDAGEHWEPLPAAAEPSTATANTTYWWIDFPTPRAGILTGSSRPPRHGRTSDLPAWRDPDPEERRKEWPAVSITLETRDGGETWKHSVTSLFGLITRIRYSKEGRGLVLMEFHDAFAYPSEVYAIDLKKGGASERAFRRPDRAVTDLLLFNGPRAVLATIEPPGNPARSTLGRLHFYESGDLSQWTEMPLPAPVDAGRVWLCGGNPDDLWAVTDTGVFLRYRSTN
jgi:photosystem II stability/assembly factor-like uncharacterized protein